MDIREAVAFGFREYVVSDEECSDQELFLSTSPKPLGYYRRLRFVFPNEYEASVIRTPGSYGVEQGLWEIATVWNGGIYGDPIGYLTPKEVHEELTKIFNLQPKEDT
jgi:hypothetical protein